MAKYTQREIDIYKFIQNKIKKDGYPPTIREICEGVSLKSTSSVHTYIINMEKKGMLKKSDTKTRAISLNYISELSEEYPENIENFNLEYAEIPVVGKVAAGNPIFASDNIEDYFPIPMSFVGPGEHFMLRVQGESMINAGILDRDYILVKKQEYANNGNIVVALIDDSATVKTYYKGSKYIVLKPENPDMEPIKTQDVSILGIVKGVFRRID